MSIVGTTCNDPRSLRNTFGWMGALQAPQQSHGKDLVELAPWKLQRICIVRHLNLGLILPNNTWMVMHFVMCIALQNHRKIPKVQNFQFLSFLLKKRMFYGFGWIVFLKFKK